MSDATNRVDTEAEYQEILSNHAFKEMVRKRSLFSWILSIIMLGCYCLFIILLVYARNFVGAPIFEGGTVTYGIPLGVGLIILAIGLSGIYVYKANGEFDRLNKEAVSSIKKTMEHK